MKKILVIDDDPVIREIVCMALREEGFEVLSVENGSIGLQLARTHQPDLIISDIYMEFMDGYSLLAQLQDDPSLSAIPVILMTGEKSRAGMRRGMELGADDYLTKPFSMEELLNAINARFKKREIITRQTEKMLDELRINLSATIPHELKTPLTAILGFSQLMLDEHNKINPEVSLEMIRAIIKGGQRLHLLIENYLLYAQIELMSTDANKIESLRKGRITDIQSIIESRAQKKAQHFGRMDDLELEVKDASLAITREHFTKIIDELVDNAFKFSDLGTPVQVTGFGVGERYTLSFSDGGRGMKTEHIDNIGAYMQFEREVYEQQGSGMGLAIAKRLTELYNGSVHIQSELGEGTTVTVELPISK